MERNILLVVRTILTFLIVAFGVLGVALPANAEGSYDKASCTSAVSANCATDAPDRRSPEQVARDEAASARYHEQMRQQRDARLAYEKKIADAENPTVLEWIFLILMAAAITPGMMVLCTRSGQQQLVGTYLR